MHRYGIRTSDHISLFSDDARRRVEDAIGHGINIVDFVVKLTKSMYG